MGFKICIKTWLGSHGVPGGKPGWGGRGASRSTQKRVLIEVQAESIFLQTAGVVPYGVFGPLRVKPDP